MLYNYLLRARIESATRSKESRTRISCTNCDIKKVAFPYRHHIFNLVDVIGQSIVGEAATQASRRLVSDN